MPHSRRLTSILAAGLLLFAAIAANAQAYTSIVIFGDSLSDTGNDATLSAAAYTVNAQVPGPATGYNNGRFTDGLDTSPAARSYTGVWVEQLAAQLAAKPAIKNSLAGGTDFAYGFATTGTGTSVFAYGPGNALAFNVNNMGLQLSTYLATNPTITNKTLFVIWGGANDLLAATATNATQVVTQAVTNELGIMQQLINAGATDFLVVNLPPLGLVPRNNTSATTSIPATQLSAAYDSALAGALTTVPASNPGKTLHVFQLDTYTLFNTLVGPPIYKGLANVTSSSQGNTTINPDTYLFWDDLHPTTYGHSLVAAAALTAIGTPIVTTTTVATSNTGVEPQRVGHSHGLGLVDLRHSDGNRHLLRRDHGHRQFAGLRIGVAHNRLHYHLRADGGQPLAYGGVRRRKRLHVVHLNSRYRNRPPRRPSASVRRAQSRSRAELQAPSSFR